MTIQDLIEVLKESGLDENTPIVLCVDGKYITPDFQIVGADTSRPKIALW